MYFAGTILLVSLGLSVDAYSILAVIPTPSISHQVVFRPLLQELARRGHEVVVITTDPAFPKGKAPANLTEIDVHDVSYTRWRAKILTGKTTSGSSSDLLTQIQVILPLLTEIFEVQMQTEEVKELFKSKSDRFDLIMIEACVRPAVSVSHIFKAPVVYGSSFGAIMYNFDVMGIPSRPPLLYPSMIRQRIYNMSLWEKLRELYMHFQFEMLFNKIEAHSNEVIKRLFGPDIPPISELEKNIQLMLLNQHPIWEQNRPVPPSVIYMGGLHQKPSKDLPQELKSYLDSSVHGVIYLSFGTNVSPSSLPPHKIQMLVNTFSQLPLDVLWKWDRDELPGKSPNIRISKWLPQSDLLKHPKVKLFITQGGLQSTDEAITAGVPLIGIPMLGDQWFNVEQYTHHKIGLRLDMDTLTEQKLLDAINTILKDDSYHKNIVKLRNIMVDQPQKPLDRAVWWTEHVMRHRGAPHLRSPLANMSWAEYLDFELLAVLATAASITITIILIALYFLVKILSKHMVSKKVKSS